MALTTNERKKRHRAKKKAKWVWKGGLICKICREEKKVGDFRARGKGREMVCLECKRGGSVEMRIWMREQEELLGRRVDAGELREYLQCKKREKACMGGCV